MNLISILESYQAALEGLKKSEEILTHFPEKESNKYLYLLAITHNNMGCYYKKYIYKDYNI